MHRRRIYVVLFAGMLSLILTSGARAELVGQWRLDETDGALARDSTRGRNHGVVHGGARWVAGQVNGAMEFDGVDDYVELPIGPTIESLGDCTLAVWVDFSNAGGWWQRIFDFGNGSRSYMYLTPRSGWNGPMLFAITTNSDAGEDQVIAPWTLATGWHHVAVVIDGARHEMQLYLDGAVVASATTKTLPRDLGRTTQNWLGRSQYSFYAYLDGILDDFRIYNVALSHAEIEGILPGVDRTMAAGPSPPYGAEDVRRDVVLTWKPGQYSAGHDVYFGTDPVHVAAADRDNPLGVLVRQAQEDVAYDPAGLLEFGWTYYWRVDETGPATFPVVKGDVWCFTTEPVACPIQNLTATASSSHNADMGPGRTVDGSGINANDQHSTAATTMWLSAADGSQPTWITYAFDKVYRLHDMWVWNSNRVIESSAGFGLKDVVVEYSTDASAWTRLTGVSEFARATGSGDYVHDTVVHFDGVPARYVKITASSNWGSQSQYGLSEVRFFHVPTQAREPSPSFGARCLNVNDLVLSWRKGREAAKHQVYLSSDRAAVENGTALIGEVDEDNIKVSSLNLGTTYYWKVNEVNEAENPSFWRGDVWSFTTRGCLVAEQRSVTLAELDTPDITTPIARLVGSALTDNGYTGYFWVWVSDDGQNWRHIFCSSVYQHIYGDLPGPRRSHVYYILLDSFPRFVRVGTTAWYTGSVEVDGLEIIAPDGTAFRPNHATPVNDNVVGNPEAALVIDGQEVSVGHCAICTDEERDQIDAVQLTFDYPMGIASQIKPLTEERIPLPPLRFGVYGTGTCDDDPYDTPAGYAYCANAADIARYDFSILNTRNADIRVRIKELNPHHRIIVRGWFGVCVMLDYFYDQQVRESTVQAMLDWIAPTPEQVYAITLNEEELMWQFWGWWDNEAPAWLTKYRDKYEQETGNKFEFRSAPLERWLKEKARFLYNDLYDRIKAVYPHVKVFPFLYVPGDISGWAFLDPSEIKADGWVYQWLNADTLGMVKPCRHALPEIAQVAVQERWFNQSIQKIRAAGVPMDDVYVQIWLFQTGDDYRPQLEGVRAAGVGNVFCFYYYGWVPPEPPMWISRRDLAFKAFGAESLPWPEATHANHPDFLTLDWGRAQSFIAAADRMERVALYLASPDGVQMPVHTVTIEGNGHAIPDGKALAIAELDPTDIQGEGWVQVRLPAEVRPDDTYWLTVRPKDAMWSPLRLGATMDDSFPNGQCVDFEDKSEGYFRNWRTYDITQLPNGDWAASYRQRMAVESLFETTMGKPAANINGDCAVDSIDLALMAGQWIEGGGALEGDLDRNHVVDFKDYVILAESWLAGEQ